MEKDKIFDEFTNLNVSHQRKSQLRNEKKGLCIICGQPAKDSFKRCEKHLEYVRKNNAKYRGADVRKLNSKYGKAGERFII